MSSSSPTAVDDDNQFWDEPNEKKVWDESKWKRLARVTAGDPVYAKSHKVAKTPTSLTHYTKAIVVHCDSIQGVISKHNQEQQQPRNFKVRLLLENQQETTTPPITITNVERSLLPGTYFDFCMPHVVRFHKLLAKSGRYLVNAASGSAAGTNNNVWALWEDEVYAATVLKNPPFHEIGNIGDLEDTITESNMTGPFVWVEWNNEDGAWNIVPKSHCIVQEDDNGASSSKPTAQELRRRSSSQEQYVAANAQDLTPEQAMMHGMASMGKHYIVQEKPVPVTAYWDGKWYEGTTTGNNHIPPLEILAQHLHFENIRGNYYCVKWAEEDTYDLLPECLIDFSTI